MAKNDPAFPNDSDTFAYGFMGLTKLEWFAGMALNAMHINPTYETGQCNAAVVDRAYQLAEGMLAEAERRSK